MLNIREFVYNKIKSLPWISEKVEDRIYSEKIWEEKFPCVIFSKISSKFNKIWVRTEFFQVSIWTQNIQENDEILAIFINNFRHKTGDEVELIQIWDVRTDKDLKNNLFASHCEILMKFTDNFNT